MEKTEFIERYSKEAWENHLVQGREYYKEHKEEENARGKKYREEHPEAVIVANQEACRKGGRYYNRKLEYMRTGMQGARCRIRVKHANQYKPYKDIIVPDSQLHHQWRPQSPLYDGLALVETDQHMHGIIDVIKILDGKITLFTEKELKI